jgi:HEAT repeats
VSSEAQAEPTRPGVQRAFDLMMREQVAPALRELGLTRTGRIFQYSIGDGKCEIHWQKDTRQSRDHLLRFTMNLDWGWGLGRIYELMPVPAVDPWWELRAGGQTQPVAESVVAAIRCYAVPAMQAGLDDLTRQQAPESHWLREFPAVPVSPRQPDGGGASGDTWYMQPTGTKADFWFAGLTSEVAVLRWEAAKGVTQTEPTNPRTVPALLDRLEHDPAPFVRKEIASRMLTLLARDPLVWPALQASAAEDEDRTVRGAAFYALRLDLDRDPGREALARWPHRGGISGAEG